MTIRLAPDKVVRRKIDVPRYGAMTVIVSIEGVYYREYKRKKMFLIPHGYAFLHAVQLHLARERAEKKAKRASRKHRGSSC